MSKTLSLETRTIYQLSLIAIGLACLVVIGLSTSQAIKLFKQPKDEPVVKIREQQLRSAIKLISPSQDVH